MRAEGAAEGVHGQSLGTVLDGSEIVSEMGGVQSDAGRYVGQRGKSRLVLEGGMLGVG